MEILIIGVLILLLIVGVFVHNQTVARYKHAQEQIQKRCEFNSRDFRYL